MNGKDKKKHLNIILANCPINNGNRGCVALAVSTMFILDKILREKGISYTFYLPQSGYREREEHRLTVVGVELRYVSLVDITPLNMKQRLKNVAKFREYAVTRNAYRSADFILDIGQGDSFADIYGKRRFEYIFSQYRLGMKYKRPYCILPQTIGPYSDANIRKRACRGIGYAQCVMTRDRQSYDYVKQLLPQKDVAEVIDVAFFMPFERKEFDKSSVHVGLNISSLLWHGGYTRDNQFGLKADYQRLVRSVIDFFLGQEGVKLHLIPHVVGAERHVENDYAVAYDLCEEYNHPNLVLSPLFLDPISAKSYIAGMDFFMGARMHATIAAFSSGVPVVPMAYSRKFNGLFCDTLSYPNIVDLKVQTAEEALGTIKAGFEQKASLKAAIDGQMSTTVAQRQRLLEEKLREFLQLAV